MDLVQQLNALVAGIASLQQQLVDAETAATQLAEQKYQEGFQAGVLSVQVPGPVETPTEKTYNEAEVVQMVADALAPVQAELDSVKAELETLKAELAAAKAPVEEQISAAVAQALATQKENLRLAWEQQQASENQTEGGFGEMLK